MHGECNIFLIKIENYKIQRPYKVFGSIRNDIQTKSENLSLIFQQADKCDGIVLTILQVYGMGKWLGVYRVYIVSRSI